MKKIVCIITLLFFAQGFSQYKYKIEHDLTFNPIPGESNFNFYKEPYSNTAGNLDPDFLRVNYYMQTRVVKDVVVNYRAPIDFFRHTSYYGSSSPFSCYKNDVDVPFTSNCFDAFDRGNHCVYPEETHPSLFLTVIVPLQPLRDNNSTSSPLNKCEPTTIRVNTMNCQLSYSVRAQYEDKNGDPRSRTLFGYARRNTNFNIQYSDFPELADDSSISIWVNYVENPTNDNERSDILSYNYIDCSPRLVGDPTPIPSNCSYSNDGSFTAEFHRILDASRTERMMVYLEKHNPGLGPITDDSSWEQGDIDPHIIPDNLAMNGTEITWPAVLPAGTYRLRWLSKYGTGNFDNPNSAEKSDSFEIFAPDPITFTSSYVNETCPDSNDGSITFSNVQGGTPPYWYSIENGAAGSWRNTPSFSGLSDGNYTLVVSDHDNNEDNRCFSQEDDVLEERNITLIEPASSPQVLAGLFAVTPPTVHGGSWSIDISASGGVGSSYTFAWTMDEDAGFSATTEDISNADVAIPSGGTATFKVRAFDSRGCASLERVFTITEPAPLGITFSEPVPIDCYRGTGSIRAQATGGFLGVDNNYTYSWSDNGSTDPVRHNLSPGRYTVTVTDANNNSETESYELQDPDELTVVPIPTMVDCRGGNTGSITLNITGGTGAYNVSWSKVFDDSFSRTGPSISNLTTGTYFYEVTDENGCTVNNYTTGIEITQVVPTIHIGEDKVLCEGDAHQIDARISDPGALYQWVSDTGFSSTSPEVELTEPGNYILTITNSLGCEASDDVMISRATELVGAQFAVSSQVFTGEGVVLVDLSNPTPDVIEWVLPEGAEVITSETGYAEVVFKEAGEYVFGMYTELGECQAYQEKRVVVIEREKFTEGEGGDVSENDKNSLIENYVVYPNPSDGAFTLEIGLSEEKSVSVRIFGLVNNAMVDYRNLQNNKDYLIEYDLRHVSAGIYFIVLETPVSTQVKKLIIE